MFYDIHIYIYTRGVCLFYEIPRPERFKTFFGARFSFETTNRLKPNLIPPDRPPKGRYSPEPYRITVGRGAAARVVAATRATLTVIGPYKTVE